MQGSGLVSRLALPEEKLAGFLRQIEAGYLDNPYHSRVHAAGVLQITHLLAHGLIQNGVFDDLLQLSAYMAAAAHDHKHPGLTNDFLIKTRHELAVLYNVSLLSALLVCSFARCLYSLVGQPHALQALGLFCNGQVDRAARCSQKTLNSMHAVCARHMG